MKKVELTEEQIATLTVLLSGEIVEWSNCLGNPSVREQGFGGYARRQLDVMRELLDAVRA